MTEPSSDRCGYEFRWDDPTLQSGDPTRINGEIIGITFDDVAIHNHSCARETQPGTDRCAWHAEDCGTEDLEDVLENEDPDFVCDANFENVDSFEISEIAFVRAEFTGTIRDVEIRKSVMVFSSFEDCELIDVALVKCNLQRVDFSKAHMMEGRNRRGVDLSNSRCEGAIFSQAAIGRLNVSQCSLDQTTEFDPDRVTSSINFCGADLSETDLSDIRLSDSQFNNSNLRAADFRKSRLSGSSFRNANCLGTDFTGSELENADFSGANLEGAVFDNAEFHSAVFTDAQISYNTDIDKISVYERKSEVADKFEARETRVLKALWTYRALQKLSRENALLDRTREYYLQEKDLRRRQYYREWSNDPESNVLIEFNGEPSWKYRTRILLQIIKAEGANRTIKYGEGLWQVVRSSLFVVILFSLAYPLFGLRGTSGTIRYWFLTSADIQLADQPDLMLETFLFSVFTFTRVGLSELSPVGGSGLLSAAEGVTGAIFVALLVFVLGRRTTY